MNGACSIQRATKLSCRCRAAIANNANVPRTTAIAGGGVILMPTFIIGDDLRAGRLVRLLPDYPPAGAGLALYPPGRHLSAKVRSFVDFLVGRFGGEPTWDRV